MLRMTSTRGRSILKARRFHPADCGSLPVEGTSGPLRVQGLFVPPRKAVAGGRLRTNTLIEPTDLLNPPRGCAPGRRRCWLACEGWHALADVSAAWRSRIFCSCRRFRHLRPRGRAGYRLSDARGRTDRHVWTIAWNRV